MKSLLWLSDVFFGVIFGWISLNLESEPTLPVRGGSQDAARDHCTIACGPRVHLLTSSGRLEPEVKPSSISFKEIDATKLPKGIFTFEIFHETFANPNPSLRVDENRSS